MNENIELVKHIYKDSEMATYTITELLNDLKEKDNKIKDIGENILKEYQHFLLESKKLLEDDNEELPSSGMMSKIGAKIGIIKDVTNDNSDSSIADMLIKGISMGSIEMEKKISNYKDKVDKKYMDLANNFLKFQEKSINELKKYL